MNNQKWNYTSLAIIGYLAFIALSLVSLFHLGKLLGSIFW